ncbi:MAG: cell wall-binding repeat-containing protein, partial [Solirubrobacterales bacterium]
RRISGEDPVSNAIEFARHVDATFGWGITDPGHGLVIANSARPADAGAAASLSAGGTYGPLLITDSATQLPPALKGFLASIQPGYRDDPTRALYNHVWLIGDGTAISGAMQGQIDDLAELVQIGGGQASPLAAPPSTGTSPEQEPVPGAGAPKSKGKNP